jgi:hypothetical protein
LMYILRASTTKNKKNTTLAIHESVLIRPRLVCLTLG